MKRKTKALKAIKGNFKKSGESNVPKMPRGLLSPDSKKQWRRLLRLVDHKILLPCDSIALALVADCLAERDRIKRVFADKSDSKEYFEVLELQNRMVYDGLARFFVTPLSRPGMV